MFKKAEVVMMDNGAMRFINVEFDDSVLTEIVNAEKEGDIPKRHYLQKLGDLYQSTMFKLAEKSGEYEGDTLLRTVEQEINMKLQSDYDAEIKQITRNKQRNKIYDSLDEQITQALDRLEQGENVKINVKLEKEEYTPTEIIMEKVPVEELKKEPEESDFDTIEFVFSIDEEDIVKNVEKVENG